LNIQSGAQMISGDATDSPKLKDDDFRRIVKRVHEDTGIALQEHKKVMVGARVTKRLNALGMQSFSAYLDYLDTAEGKSEVTNFWNSITTNLTSFFREFHHFEHFRGELDRLDQSGAKKTRIWCAGCSTGEEAYSIATILHSSRSGKNLADLKILATDIDTKVLATAKSGTYPSERLDSFPSDIDMRLVQKNSDETFGFKDKIRNDISFRRLNFLEQWPFSGPFDVIFCRNVLIYFDNPTKKMIIDQFANMLSIGGVLYLGHSETTLGQHSQLANEGQTTYRRMS